MKKEKTELEKFQDLAKKVLSVQKSEIDKREKKRKKRKACKKT